MQCMVPGNASNEADGGRVASQLRKGVLEYCVLALLRGRPLCGVELVEQLSAGHVMATTQGTIYPLLSRLRRDALVDSQLRESAAGPPRRYYSLTDGGHAALEAFATYWPDFRDTVDHFLAEPLETSDENP
ncbi:transcriptional regulator, PadR family [Streptomyces sp. WMMB 714]|jgi:PadR family transcriptional regulator PadR|nr:transcriptional regulator, PadR family [Streptomyces sp. WMMB 714]